MFKAFFIINILAKQCQTKILKIIYFNKLNFQKCLNKNLEHQKNKNKNFELWKKRRDLYLKHKHFGNSKNYYIKNNNKYSKDQLKWKARKRLRLEHLIHQKVVENKNKKSKIISKIHIEEILF